VAGEFPLQILRHDIVVAHPHQVQQRVSVCGVVLLVQVADFEVLENIVHNHFVPLVVDAAAALQYGSERVLFLAAPHGVFFQGCRAAVDHEHQLFRHSIAPLCVIQIASLQKNSYTGSRLAAAGPQHDVGSVAPNQPLHLLVAMIINERTVASILHNRQIVVAEKIRPNFQIPRRDPLEIFHRTTAVNKTVPHIELSVPKHRSRQHVTPLHDKRQEAHVSQLVRPRRIENRAYKLAVVANVSVRLLPDQEIKQIQAKVCAPSPVLMQHSAKNVVEINLSLQPVTPSHVIP